MPQAPQLNEITIHSRYMSQISQLSKLAISVAACITAGVPHTTFSVPQQPNLLPGAELTQLTSRTRLCDFHG